MAASLLPHLTARQDDFNDSLAVLETSASSAQWDQVEYLLERMSMDVCNAIPLSVEEWDSASIPARATERDCETLDRIAEILDGAGENRLLADLTDICSTLLEDEAGWIPQLIQQAELEGAITSLKRAESRDAFEQALPVVAFLTSALPGIRRPALLSVDDAMELLEKASRLAVTTAECEALRIIVENNGSHGFLEDFCELHEQDFEFYGD